MNLLVDLFGYLSILLHALTVTAQSVMLGALLFLLLLARPLAPQLLPGESILRGAARIVRIAALALLLCEGLMIALQTAVLSSTVELPVSNVLQADFALAGMAKMAAALAIAVLVGRRVPDALLLLLGLAELAAATLTTHAQARLDHRLPLLLVEGLHQLGAAIWIGGLPCFLLALSQVRDGVGWRLVGRRYSLMSMAGVACIVLSGLAMSVAYIGSWQGFYGTAYGVMVGAKVAMFLLLLGLGAGNYRLVERLRADPRTPVNRLRRFAEAEFAIGLCIFFAAASLTSAPPAVDLVQDRVSLHEIAQRNMPVWPRLASPEHDALALSRLQKQLDDEAARRAQQPAPAYVPGSGVAPPSSAADIAWSEYNHHWAGVFVLAIGLLALLNGLGWRAARHWPLLFLGLAVFLFIRSDPEAWPLGPIGFFASLRDVEIFQHRVFVLLIVVFGLFEWRVRAGGLAPTRAAWVFPLLTIAGGALLLTHTHTIANVKDQLLIELTHTPLALLGILGGVARWLELRLEPPGSRIVGLVWPISFVLIGLILLNYREA